MHTTRKAGLEVTNWVPVNSEAQKEKNQTDWFCAVDLAYTQTAEVKRSSETSALVKPPHPYRSIACG